MKKWDIMLCKLPLALKFDGLLIGVPRDRILRSGKPTSLGVGSRRATGKAATGGGSED